MGLVIAGERLLWLNLRSLPDPDKQGILDSLFDPSQAKGLFGETVTSMQQASDLRKEQGEAFNLCLPCKTAAHQLQPTCPGFVVMAARGHSGSFRGPRFQPPEQPAPHQHRSKSSGAKSLSPPPLPLPPPLMLHQIDHPALRKGRRGGQHRSCG